MSVYVIILLIAFFSLGGLWLVSARCPEVVLRLTDKDKKTPKYQSKLSKDFSTPVQPYVEAPKSNEEESIEETDTNVPDADEHILESFKLRFDVVAEDVWEKDIPEEDRRFDLGLILHCNYVEGKGPVVVRVEEVARTKRVYKSESGNLLTNPVSSFLGEEYSAFALEALKEYSYKKERKLIDVRVFPSYRYSPPKTIKEE